MKEFDLDRLKIASVYISRMADGRNPANNQPVDDPILDNPNVIRCLHFIREVLDEVRQNKGVVGKKASTPKDPFPLEILDQFVYRHDKPVSHVLKQFAEPAEERNIRRPNPAAVNKWLAANGYIEKRIHPQSQRECWYPLQKGLDAGMYTEERGIPDNQYVTVMYSEKGQRFLAEHLGEILEDIKQKKDK